MPPASYTVCSLQRYCEEYTVQDRVFFRFKGLCKFMHRLACRLTVFALAYTQRGNYSSIITHAQLHSHPRHFPVMGQLPSADIHTEADYDNLGGGFFLLALAWGSTSRKDSIFSSAPYLCFGSVNMSYGSGSGWPIDYKIFIFSEISLNLWTNSKDPDP